MRQPNDVVQESRSDRRPLLLMALFYTPLALASGGGSAWLLLLILGGEPGALVGLTVVGLVFVATGYQSITAFRDLGAERTTTTGIVLRKRRPGIFLMLGRTHYLRLAAGAFIVSVPAFHELQEDDEVEIEHWPHTRRVTRVRLLRRAAEIEQAAAERAATAEGGDAAWRPPHLR